MEDYIRAEASGWKGRKAVALAFQDKSREFFSRVMREGARRSRVLIVQIKAGDSFVASSAVLLSRGGGAFFYKTAYDEQFARFSPGQLLDMQLIRKIHERADIAWVDSCVAPSFLHYLRWVDEKTLANITIAMNLRGNLAFRAENAAQALRDFVTKAISVIKPARTLSGDAE
jgi:CelD/BcsL family acetyltransferase involved in cellulose biosynthesis